jgi:hypothetical protein
VKYDDFKNKLNFQDSLIRYEGMGYGFCFGVLFGWLLTVGTILIILPMM